MFESHEGRGVKIPSTEEFVRWMNEIYIVDDMEALPDKVRRKLAVDAFMLMLKSPGQYGAGLETATEFFSRNDLTPDQETTVRSELLEVIRLGKVEVYRKIAQLLEGYKVAEKDKDAIASGLDLLLRTADPKSVDAFVSEFGIEKAVVDRAAAKAIVAQGGTPTAMHYHPDASLVHAELGRYANEHNYWFLAPMMIALPEEYRIPLRDVVEPERYSELVGVAGGAFTRGLQGDGRWLPLATTALKLFPEVSERVDRKMLGEQALAHLSKALSSLTDERGKGALQRPRLEHVLALLAQMSIDKSVLPHDVQQHVLQMLDTWAQQNCREPKGWLGKNGFETLKVVLPDNEVEKFAQYTEFAFCYEERNTWDREAWLEHFLELRRRYPFADCPVRVQGLSLLIGEFLRDRIPENAASSEVMRNALGAAVKIAGEDECSIVAEAARAYPAVNYLRIPEALARIKPPIAKDRRIPEEILGVVSAALRDGKDVDIGSVNARATHALMPEEYVGISSVNPAALELMDGKPNYELLFSELAENAGLVPDEDIRECMKTFRDLFGAEIALKYANRPGLSRHDAYYFAPKVAKFFRGSGFPSVEFTGILLQVTKDDAVYQMGNAHHHLAVVMDQLARRPLGEIYAHAAQFSNIPQIQDLIQDLREGGLRTWKRLKKFHDLDVMLGKYELLAELDKGEMSIKLRAYVSKLAFHPNINTHAVVDFWKDTAAFLEIEDLHTDEEIEAVKKPSNYLSLPYLGIHAADLRDALVEGSIDTVQTMPAFEQMYVLYENDRENPDMPENLHGFLRRAIGQQRKGVPGEAKDVKKLFAEVQAWCRANEVKWNDLWEGGEAMVVELPEEKRTALAALVFDESIGMAKPVGETYRMVLGNKSDPEMVVAGNDTASCMPFGSGKNNVYMYNPNCMQLVAQRRTSEGDWRTVAQSVVTIDVNSGKSTPELIDAYKHPNARLKDLLDVAVLQQLGVITCDNIEVAKNDEGKRRNQIKKIYDRFWTAYLERHAKDLNVDAGRIIVGAGYTPTDLGMTKVSNTFIPLAPMGYSDNSGSDSFELRTGLPSGEYRVTTDVSPMTTRDVFAVAILEGKAYHDNVSLLENLHGMQNNIIGMEIANAHRGRPNLSFVYRDRSGVPKGYMLAYEGVDLDKPGIYVADLAADPESKVAGGKLVTSFFDAYVVNYGSERRPFVPIIANARDATSYRMLESILERMATRAGLVADMVTMKTYEREKVSEEGRSTTETFHDVVIFVGRDAADVEEQKIEYFSRGIEIDSLS